MFFVSKSAPVGALLWGHNLVSITRNSTDGPVCRLGPTSARPNGQGCVGGHAPAVWGAFNWPMWVLWGALGLWRHTREHTAGGDIGHYGPANRPNGPGSAAVLSHTPRSDLRLTTHPPEGPPAARIGFSCCRCGSGRWHSAGFLGLQGGMQAGNCPREVHGDG